MRPATQNSCGIHCGVPSVVIDTELLTQVYKRDHRVICHYRHEVKSRSKPTTSKIAVTFLGDSYKERRS